MNNKRFFKGLIIGTAIFLASFAALTIAVDPFFHFHAPLKNLEYPLWDERYQNDGILRHFTYDSVITGTSVTENFQASLFDQLFDTNSVKVPLAGGTYREINDQLTRAFSYNSNIRYVVRSLDPTALINSKDDLDYSNYPKYLYDNNPFNDVKYIFNEDVFFDFTCYVFTFMKQGGTSTDMDAYSSWYSQYFYNFETVMGEYDRPAKSDAIVPLTEEERKMTEENIAQNVTSLIEKNPQTQFILFIPPYNIAYWDSLQRSGTLKKNLDAMEILLSTLVKYDNVSLYGFADDFETVCDFNHYRDSIHYDQDISDLILNRFATDEWRLTEENYKEYLEKIGKFYGEYDYAGVFGE